MAGRTQRIAPALLDAAVLQLKQAKLETALFDVTPEEVRGFGLFVVRAVIPALVRQSVGLTLRHLGNRRIISVPAGLGYPSERTSVADILLNGVPFP
jgi:hypothetical protein